MKKSFLVASVTLLFATISVGEKKVVDCKFVTGNVEQCMPYPQKLYRTELTRTKENNKKLTIVKTQPMHKKTQRVRVINVEEMIEKHLEVYAPKRFGRNLDENSRADEDFARTRDAQTPKDGAFEPKRAASPRSKYDRRAKEAGVCAL